MIALHARSSVWRALRLMLLIAAVLVALGHATGLAPRRFVTGLDLAIADTRQRALMPRTLDERIVIVDVDEKSLAEIGRWPWGRDRLAALTDELFGRQRAAVVGFDMLFAEPDTSSGLAALERLALPSPGNAARLAPELAAGLEARIRALGPELDYDARFARSLEGGHAVLGYYLTNLRGARRVGTLPAPVFDAADLHGRAIDLTRWDGHAADIAPLARAAPRAGYINNLPDLDGIVRSVPLVAEIDRQHHEALALAVFRASIGDPAMSPLWPTARGLPGDYTALQGVRLLRGDGHTWTIPVGAQGRLRVPYRGPAGPAGGSFEYVSASDLLAGRIAPGHLAGKIVLVGTTAPGLYDQRATPVADVYPGVEVHASLVSGLLDGRLAVQPDWASSAEVLQLLLVAVVLAIGLPRLRPVHGAQLAFALIAVLIALNVWAEHARGLLMPLASELLLAGVLYVGITVWGYIVEGRSRRSLARLFGSYVPPELVAEMARDPARYDMRAENRELTMMFCDMRDFTRVSELLSPEELRGLVNRFFSRMTTAIRAHRGTLDKYIGDAIMAFWGAPLRDPAHAAHAVRAALEMTQRMHALNTELRGRGLPEIGVGIGLNSGLVCVGDMGSSMRRSYTVMGDAVNMASRIEGLTRHYGVDILVGESTREAAETNAVDRAGEVGEGLLRWVEIDRVRVKGKQRSVTLFTPVKVPVASTVAFDDEMRIWQLALTAYRLQQWDQAQASLQSLHSAHGGSAFAGLYRQFDQRIDHHRSTPLPIDWDGAHNFSSK